MHLAALQRRLRATTTTINDADALAHASELDVALFGVRTRDGSSATVATIVPRRAQQRASAALPQLSCNLCKRRRRATPFRFSRLLAVKDIARHKLTNAPIEDVIKTAKRRVRLKATPRLGSSLCG